MNLVSDRSKFGPLVQHWTPCTKCEIGCLAKKKVFGFGTIPAKYLFVGEAPGIDEDREGEPFVGRSGVLLRKTLNKANFKLKEIFITNTVACRPTDYFNGPNRRPNLSEITNCQDRLGDTIKIIRPKFVVAVGRVAEQILCENMSKYNINCIFPIWHPSYILRNGGEGSAKYNIWLEKIRHLKD